MPLHRKQFLLRHQHFWFFSGGQFVLHPGVWWKTSECRNCFWVGLQESLFFFIHLLQIMIPFVVLVETTECRLADQYRVGCLGRLLRLQMWADSDRLLSERSFGSGWRSGSGNGRDFRAKHTEQRTGAPGFFLHLHQFSGTGRIAFGDKGPITRPCKPLQPSAIQGENLFVLVNFTVLARARGRFKNFVHVASKQVFRRGINLYLQLLQVCH
jgi:hypothetical protein